MNPLNAIRCGTPADSRAAMDLLCAACQRPLDDSDGIRPTVLFSRNADVEESNERELDALPTDKVRVVFAWVQSYQHAICAAGREGACISACVRTI